MIAAQGLAADQSLSGEKNRTVYSLFCIFLSSLSLVVVVLLVVLVLLFLPYSTVFISAHKFPLHCTGGRGRGERVAVWP